MAEEDNTTETTEETKTIYTKEKITSPESLSERYKNVCDAIDKILIGGQEYEIGTRKLKRADLSTLIAMRDELESALVTQKRGQNPGLMDDTVVAYFEGR